MTEFTFNTNSATRLILNTIEQEIKSYKDKGREVPRYFTALYEYAKEQNEASTTPEEHGKDTLEDNRYTVAKEGKDQAVTYKEKSVNTVFSQERFDSLVNSISNLGLTVLVVELNGVNSLLMMSGNIPVASYNLSDSDDDIKMSKPLVDILSRAEDEKEFLVNTLDNKPTEVENNNKPSDWDADEDYIETLVAEVIEDDIYEMVDEALLPVVCELSGITVDIYDDLPTCDLKNKINATYDVLEDSIMSGISLAGDYMVQVYTNPDKAEEALANLKAFGEGTIEFTLLPSIEKSLVEFSKLYITWALANVNQD